MAALKDGLDGLWSTNVSRFGVHKKVNFIEDSFYRRKYYVNEFELVADDIQILIDNLPEGYKLVLI
jgi:hypothetical protein